MTFLELQQWIYLNPGTLLKAPEIYTTKNHPKVLTLAIKTVRLVF